MNNKIVKGLYIPLRSDKTNALKSTVVNLANFISHYVQIKPLHELLKNSINMRLYIPLRSDKT